jgi:hypothetical protein
MPLAASLPPDHGSAAMQAAQNSKPETSPRPSEIRLFLSPEVMVDG